MHDDRRYTALVTDINGKAVLACRLVTLCAWTKEKHSTGSCRECRQHFDMEMRQSITTIKALPKQDTYKAGTPIPCALVG